MTITTSPRRIFHITERETWEQAKSAGEYRATSLATEGFIHCSLASQLKEIADTHYAGREGMVVLEIAPIRLGASELRMEDEFPHVYGPVPLPAVVFVHELKKVPEGGFEFRRRLPEEENEFDESVSNRFFLVRVWVEEHILLVLLIVATLVAAVLLLSGANFPYTLHEQLRLRRW